MGRRAALLATETPPRKRALVAALPAVGRADGFFLPHGTFLLLSPLLTDEQFSEAGLARAAVYLLGGAGDYRPVCARVAA